MSNPETIVAGTAPTQTHRQVHGVRVSFRLNERIAASAERLAQAEGMSLSELVRHALRRELRDAA